MSAPTTAPPEADELEQLLEDGPARTCTNITTWGPVNSRGRVVITVREHRCGERATRRHHYLCSACGHRSTRHLCDHHAERRAAEPEKMVCMVCDAVGTATITWSEAL